MKFACESAGGRWTGIVCEHDQAPSEQAQGGGAQSWTPDGTPAPSATATRPTAPAKPASLATGPAPKPGLSFASASRNPLVWVGALVVLGGGAILWSKRKKAA